MSKKPVVDLPDDVLIIITTKLLDDPDREFHIIFHHTQKNKRIGKF
jgi:hypothetical protein